MLCDATSTLAGTDRRVTSLIRTQVHCHIKGLPFYTASGITILHHISAPIPSPKWHISLSVSQRRPRRSFGPFLHSCSAAECCGWCWIMITIWKRMGKEQMRLLIIFPTQVMMDPCSAALWHWDGTDFFIWSRQQAPNQEDFFYLVIFFLPVGWCHHLFFWSGRLWWVVNISGRRGWPLFHLISP